MVLLIFAMIKCFPDPSFFPELDFASKVVKASAASEEKTRLWSSLSDASSETFRKTLAGKKFYVHDLEDE
jgi:hypothetical protein